MSEPTLPPSNPEPASKRTEHVSRGDSPPAAGLGSPTVELTPRERPALQNEPAVSKPGAATIDDRPDEPSIAVGPAGGHTTDFNINDDQHSRAASVDPNPATIDPAAVPAPSTATVGNYDILGELGRGGMGVVYKARHRRLHRLVALKMILAGGRARAIDLERFQSEAEAIALVHHRSIVQIYEIGEHDGQPFIALEFVTGGSLDERTTGKIQTPRDAALLVKQLADALEVAHSNGIIHRDLKPANVLLAGDPGAPLDQCVPKITDFGLARRFDGDSSQTSEGSVLGTPSYMSPEQAQGKQRALGPPTDIYALGAILYDLLTGEPPFRGPTILDTLRLVVETEPRPPIHLQPSLPRDLQIICMKCLEKEPARRYNTAGELAEDLRRFLDGEPILARPVPVWERAWKWCRRRPSLTALIGVIVLSLLLFGIGGFAVAVAQARLRKDAENEREAKEIERQRAEDNFRKAEAARAAEERERRRAEGNFAEARDAVNQLTDIGQRRLAHEPHMELVRRDILDTALHFHRHFLEINGDKPALRYQTGLAHLRIGEIQDSFGERAAAEKEYRAAADQFAALLAEEPGKRDYRDGLAIARGNLGLLYQAANRPEADAVLDEVVRMREELMRDHPQDRDLRHALAYVRNNRGILRQMRQDVPGAEEDFNRALELETALTTEFPHVGGAKPREGTPQGEELTRMTFQQELARAHLNLGGLWTGRQTAKADACYAQAARLLGGLSGRYPDLPQLRQELARTYLNRGALRHVAKQGNEANADYQEASRILARLAGEFRSVPDYRQLLADTYANHAKLLADAKLPAEAEKLWHLAVPQLKTLADEFPAERGYRQKLGRSYNDLGIALGVQNKLSKSEQAFRDGLAVLEPLAQKAPEDAAVWHDLAYCSANLSALLVAAGRHDDAEVVVKRVLDSQQARAKTQPADRRGQEDLAESLNTFAGLLAGRKQDAEAAIALEECAAAWARTATLARQDKALPEAERLKAEEKGRRLALTALGQALDRGLKDVARLRDRTEFAGLRDAPAFQKLLERRAP
jgi:serine/threonine-protein kinase